MPPKKEISIIIPFKNWSSDLDECLIQIQKLSSVKKNRNQSKVTKSLENLENVANTKNNIMPAIIEAVESYSTIGEISDIFRKIYGEYSPDY